MSCRAVSVHRLGLDTRVTALTVELVTVGGMTVERCGELVLVLGVVPGLLELLGRRLLHVVGEPELGELGAQAVEPSTRSVHARGIGLGVGGVDLVAVASGQRVGSTLADRQVTLGVAAFGRAEDDPGLVAVEQLLLVVPLQGDAPAPRDPEGDRRSHEHRHPHEVGDLVDAQVELDRDQVVAARGPHQAVEGHQRDHECRARRRVARTLQQVVLPLVPGDPGLQERQEQQDREHQQDRRDEGAEEEDHRLGLIPVSYQPGMIRSAPSGQPMYQSGWEPAVTLVGS